MAGELTIRIVGIRRGRSIGVGRAQRLMIIRGYRCPVVLVLRG